ncbi:MAG: hypothetical protein ACK41Z_14510, partial [Sediminibacterium sp.]
MRGWYSKVGSLLETLLINNSARIFKNEVQALGIGLLRCIELICFVSEAFKFLRGLNFRKKIQQKFSSRDGKTILINKLFRTCTTKPPSSSIRLIQFNNKNPL